jgi:serine/threonine-protein kinase
MQYLHSQQVIHRDIKPANIIRRNQDRKLVLIDFGAVKDQVNPAAASLSEQTALTSYAIGTPGYAPPEQMAMRPVYSSDIYALGVTCLYLLTAKSPKDLNYNPATGEMMWRKMVDVSDHFAEVLAKMLESSVKHRYQMANDVLKALDMEPYLDSLASSMIKPTQGTDKTAAKTNAKWRSPLNDSPMTGGEGGARSQRAAQMAEAIRSRRNRGPGMPGIPQVDTTQFHTDTPRSRPKVPRPKRGADGPTTAIASAKDFKGEKTPQPIRLTATEVQENYSKGKLDFASHDLSNLNLQRLNLSNANFYESRLFKTNLQNADLSNADFGKSSLKQANLRDAKLVRAYMSYANLQEADLRGADLSYAYLSNANLRGANLAGTNLTGAKVTDEQLALAKLSWNTVLPNGKRSGFFNG